MALTLWLLSAELRLPAPVWKESVAVRRISLLSEHPVQECVSRYEFFISNGQDCVSSDLFIFKK